MSIRRSSSRGFHPEEMSAKHQRPTVQQHSSLIHWLSSFVLWRSSAQQQADSIQWQSSSRQSKLSKSVKTSSTTLPMSERRIHQKFGYNEAIVLSKKSINDKRENSAAIRAARKRLSEIMESDLMVQSLMQSPIYYKAHERQGL